MQVEQAKRLLRDTNLALKIIAHRAGFSSEAYFSNVFLRECGIRPNAYRNQHSSREIERSIESDADRNFTE